MDSNHVIHKLMDGFYGLATIFFHNEEVRVREDYSGVGFIFCFSVNKLTKLCSLNKLTGHSFVLCL